MTWLWVIWPPVVVVTSSCHGVRCIDFAYEFSMGEVSAVLTRSASLNRRCNANCNPIGDRILPV